MNNLPVFPMGIVSELLNVHPETIRVWERYGVVKPQRRSGKRFYSEDDLKRLRFIQKLTGEGLNLLEEAIVETVFSGQVQTSDVPVISNPRHCEILRRASAQITAAESSYHTHGAADLVAIDLSAAVSALGEITGETVSDDVLETIFSSFCIGK